MIEQVHSYQSLPITANHCQKEAGNPKARENSGTFWQCILQRSETDILVNFNKIIPKCFYLWVVHYNHHMLMYNLNEMSWFGYLPQQLVQLLQTIFSSFQLGKNQSYDLGVALKKRYISGEPFSFLNEKYIESEVCLFSKPSWSSCKPDHLRVTWYA